MRQTTTAGDSSPRSRSTRKKSPATKGRRGKQSPPPAPRRPDGETGHKLAISVPDRLPASAPAASVRAGSPVAILAIVPYLLGFVPDASIVVIGTEPRKGTVKLTLRYDLPDPADTSLATDIAEHALAVIGSQRLTAAIAIGYGSDALVKPLATAVKAMTGKGPISLLDFLRVEGGRYWSYTCTNEVCCPPEGKPFDAASHDAAAVMGGDGTQVLAGRAAVAETIAPLEGVAAESMREATRRAEQHVSQIIARVRKSARLGTARHLIASEGLAAVAALIASYRSGGRYTADYQMAWLMVALKDLRIRDDAWARMDPSHRQAHLRLWIDAVRRARPGYVAAPASLLAFVAWQMGNGVLANVAIDRALAEDPGYSMALLLRQVISAGAPPSMARLPMTPDEVAACYENLDDEDDDDLGYEDDDVDDEDVDDEDEDDDDLPEDDGDRCPCGTGVGG